MLRTRICSSNLSDPTTLGKYGINNRSRASEQLVTAVDSSATNHSRGKHSGRGKKCENEMTGASYVRLTRVKLRFRKYCSGVFSGDSSPWLRCSGSHLLFAKIRSRPGQVAPTKSGNRSSPREFVSVRRQRGARRRMSGGTCDYINTFVLSRYDAAAPTTRTAVRSRSDLPRQSWWVR